MLGAEWEREVALDLADGNADGVGGLVDEWSASRLNPDLAAAEDEFLRGRLHRAPREHVDHLLEVVCVRVSTMRM